MFLRPQENVTPDRILARLKSPFPYGRGIKRVDDMGIKNSPVVCDGYVKYEEAEVDRLVAILKTNNCNGRPCGIIQ